MRNCNLDDLLWEVVFLPTLFFIIFLFLYLIFYQHSDNLYACSGVPRILIACSNKSPQHNPSTFSLGWWRWRTTATTAINTPTAAAINPVLMQNSYQQLLLLILCHYSCLYTYVCELSHGTKSGIVIQRVRLNSLPLACLSRITVMPVLDYRLIYVCLQFHKILYIYLFTWYPTPLWRIYM